MFIDAQTDNLRLKRLSRNSQLGGRARRASDPTSTLGQCCLDQFLLLILVQPQQSCSGQALRTRSTQRLGHQPGLVYRKGLTVTQDQAALNQVLQLSNVAWPLVSLKQFQCLLIYFLDLLPGLLRVAKDEVLN